MVPAWAAVVIALGASAIGALAGIFGAYISLRIARLSLDHQASEAWRTRRLEAAEDFSASWTVEISGVGVARGIISERGDPAKAFEALVEKHADGGAKLMRVGLLSASVGVIGLEGRREKRHLWVQLLRNAGGVDNELLRSLVALRVDLHPQRPTGVGIDSQTTKPAQRFHARDCRTRRC